VASPEWHRERGKRERESEERKKEMIHIESENADA
jgi:hypothetical protein